MSNDKKSELERKEKKNDHEIEKEKDGREEKVFIEEPSLDELNLKMVETTCLMDQEHIDDKDKGKENHFGLAKTRYGMYNWFIHVLGNPRTPKVFLKRHERRIVNEWEFKGSSNYLEYSCAYVNTFYVEESVGGAIVDA
ncbi:hypothetical protein HAX54_029120 [Datura stramonium]|uniref:Uncharacterized protein n=1 Tax=Datura stramonium TaxID=4076 RepID=A0ABS8S9Y5_DATST|nr:hypothetical protein [Datura stramonium]